MAEAGAWWIERLRANPLLQAKTVQNYERDVRAIDRYLAHVQLAMLSPVLIEHVMLEFSRQDPNGAHRAMGTLRRMLDRVTLLEIFEHNPAAAVRLERRPPRPPDALTLEQAEAVRSGFLEWRARRRKPGPKPDARVADMIDLMLVTGIRIGELLALQHRDIALDARPPRMTIHSTLTAGPKGEPIWQDRTKGRRPPREIALSQIAVDALSRQLCAIDPLAPVFPSRRGGWLRPESVRRVLRSFRDEWGVELGTTGIDGSRITPHLFRRTLATMIANQSGVDRAKEQLGHASITTTERYYVMPRRLVGLESSKMIDERFRPPG